MKELEELQGLWQQQHLLVGEMARYQQRQFGINTIKTVTVAALLALVYAIAARFLHEPLVLAGFLVMAVSIVTFLVMYWRKQFRIARLDFSAPSREFMNSAVALLLGERQVFRAPALVMALLVLVGMNVMLLGLHSGPLLHVINSLEIVAACWFGLTVRKRRFQRENQPLVDRLSAIAQDLASR
jgi:hypothetical protein